MALKITLIKKIPGFSGELVMQNAYCRIAEISGDKTRINVTVHVMPNENEKPVQTIFAGFIPMLEGEDFIAQAYGHLKTLPEFSDAVDC